MAPYSSLPLASIEKIASFLPPKDVGTICSLNRLHRDQIGRSLDFWVCQYGLRWGSRGLPPPTSLEEAKARFVEMGKYVSGRPRVLPGAGQLAAAVAFSPDGALVVTSSHDNTAKVWRVADGQLLLTLAGHSGEVETAVFSPNGTTLVTTSKGDTARLWRVSDWSLLATLSHNVNNSFFRRMLVSFSPRGDLVLTASDVKPVRLWDAANGGLVQEFNQIEDSASCLAFSPDGLLGISGSYDVDLGFPLYLWRVSDGRRVRTFNGFENEVVSAAMTPDMSMLVIECNNWFVHLMRVSDGQKVAHFDGGTLSRSCFDSSGTLLAVSVGITVDGDNEVYETIIAQTSDGSVVRRLGQNDKSHITDASSLISPDGSSVLTVSNSGQAKLWDIASGALLKTFTGGPSPSWIQAAFSPSGRDIITTMTRKVEPFTVSLHHVAG